jgi:hypothetical protein
MEAVVAAVRKLGHNCQTDICENCGAQGNKLGFLTNIGYAACCAIVCPNGLLVN